MLSRTADHLYWMARYTERAENLARMLDVTQRVALLHGGQADAANWRAALDIAGGATGMLADPERVTPAAVLYHLAFDGDNPSSIVSCLKAARENAHAVRGTLTSELWETINDTWLRVRELDHGDLAENDSGAFFEWVKYRSHLSRGVTIGTLCQDEALWFTRLGTYLERGDSTARILDVKFRLLLPEGGDADDPGDYYPWSMLLRSVSAFEIYRKVYRDRITPRRVAELFVFRHDMPRSLRHCLDQVLTLLERVGNRQSGETQRRAGLLYASLRYGRVEDLFRDGPHRFLGEFLGGAADLSERIANDFLVPRH